MRLKKGLSLRLFLLMFLVFLINFADVTKAASAQVVGSTTVVNLKASMGQLTTTLDKAAMVNFKLVYNGVSKTLSLPILQADGRTYLPLRALGEEVLSAQVDYDSANGIAIVTKGGSVVETFAGSNKLVVDGKIKDIDPNNAEAKAFIRDGRTYIPVRAVAEAFGLNVSWDGTTQTITITDSTTTQPSTNPTTESSFDSATQSLIDADKAYNDQKMKDVENGIGYHGEAKPTQPGTKHNQLSPQGDWIWLNDMQQWYSNYGN